MWGKAFAPLCVVGLVSGCAVAPQPIAEQAQKVRAESDLKTLFSGQETISGPITLPEALARALKYNLDQRLKVMEEAVAGGQLEVAKMNLLPEVVANAGYKQRSSADTTFNETRTATSTTSERGIATTDLHVSWNILDFGIGYLRAKQQADRALITRERRRQVIHNIIQETRAAYFRAAAAERAIGRFESLMGSVRDALAQSERTLQERVGSRMDALVYQRTLLEPLRQLEALRRDMLTARTELAVLMNVHPNAPFVVAGAVEEPTAGPGIDLDVARLERLALVNRGELRSESYQLRIQQEEARIALLRMIPGVNFSAGVNYTSDKYKLNNDWYDGSLQLTWNLVNIVRGPAEIELAETQQELSRVRRLALSMAVIAQVNVAELRFETAKRDADLAARLADIEDKIATELERNRQADVGTSMQVIQGEVRSALADLRRDLAYADEQAAFGRVIASIGLDPVAPEMEGSDLSALAAALERMLRNWEAGLVNSSANDDGSVETTASMGRKTAAPPTPQ